MQIQIYHNFAELPVTPESWNALVQRSVTNTIFQTYQWVKSWWEIFGYNNELFIITISGDEKLLGIAPLMLTGNSPRGKILKFIGDGKSDYCDFTILQEKEQILTDFFKLIIEYGELWDTIQLNNIPDHSKTPQIISEICQFTGLKSLFFDNIPCPSLVFNGENANILRRRSFRRRYNYFQKNGRLNYFEIADEQLAMEYLKLLFHQHQKRWELSKKVSLFSDYQNRDFYE